MINNISASMLTILLSDRTLKLWALVADRNDNNRFNWIKFDEPPLFISL